MGEPLNMVIVDNLKQTLNKILVANNFNLQHPQVLSISYEINSLLVPFFHNQLPKAKIIKFPTK